MILSKLGDGYFYVQDWEGLDEAGPGVRLAGVEGQAQAQG